MRQRFFRHRPRPRVCGLARLVLAFSRAEASASSCERCGPSASTVTSHARRGISARRRRTAYNVIEHSTQFRGHPQVPYGGSSPLFQFRIAGPRRCVGRHVTSDSQQGAPFRRGKLREKFRQSSTVTRPPQGGKGMSDAASSHPSSETSVRPTSATVSPPRSSTGLRQLGVHGVASP